jgi:hypothetical protein
MKLKFKRQHSESIEELQDKMQNVMKMLAKNRFQQRFRSRRSHWDHPINEEGG